MIGSLAALFAKKTAIVAITGVTVIGGATFALAVETDDSAAEVQDDSTSTTTTESTTTTTESTTTTSEATTTTVAESTTTTAPESDESEGEKTVAAAGDEEGEDSATDEVAEDSHGAMVSEAARNTCHKPENIAAYGNHGQCVKAFAHGEGVDHAATGDDPADGVGATTDGDSTASLDAADASADEPEITEQPKAKPAHAGPPAGKGGNGKGKGGKG